MVVPVALVGGVAVTVVKVVHVIAVGDGNVAATLAVLVSVIFMDVVLSSLALVPVALVLAVDVTVVSEVGVIVVWEGDVAAALAVGVGVLVMNGVGHNNSLVSWGFSRCFQ